MRILGVDFTSAPTRRKPIAVAHGTLRRSSLQIERLEALEDFAGFEAFLRRPGPWIGGFDFPFGLPREAVRALDWPEAWPELVSHCAAIGRAAFRNASDGLRRARPTGRKYPKRRGDAAARSHSPMKCVRPPVGWMFLEGAARLLRAGVEIPGIRRGDRLRIAVEAYPGLVARAILGRRSYKSDSPALRTAERARTRRHLWSRLARADNPTGIPMRAAGDVAERILEDGGGDRLDAAICALQAAWAWRRRASRFGLPARMDPLEGWIVTA